MSRRAALLALLVICAGCERSRAGDDSAPGPAGAPTPVALALGGTHGCALSNDGRVRCWGDGKYGALGYGTKESVPSETALRRAGDVAIGGKALALAAGTAFTCAVLEGGDVRCWGLGRTIGGPLLFGDGSTIGDNEPASAAPLIDLGGRGVAVESRAEHTCVVIDDRSLRCWGRNSEGQVGGDINSRSIIPREIGPIPVGSAVEVVTTGQEHTCAIVSGGQVRCWGHGDRLGDPSFSKPYWPPKTRSAAEAVAVALPRPATAISAGTQHTCAVLDDGAVWCWGEDLAGSVGAGIPEREDIGPIAVDVGQPARMIALGHAHTCALLTNGAVRCWGYKGLLGAPSKEDIGDDEPAARSPLVPLGEPATYIAAGVGSTCAILQSGKVSCWGKGWYGSLGRPSESEYELASPDAAFRVW